MDHYFVFSLQFSYCIYHISKTCAFILMIMFVYDFTLHILITCLNVTFTKTCVNTCTTNESQLIRIYLCLNAHLYPLDVLVQPSFDDYFSIGILYKLMHCLYQYFIKGEKNSCFIFKTILFLIGILLPFFMMKNTLFWYMLTLS